MHLVMLVLLGLSHHRYVVENISKLNSGCVWGFMWFFLMTYFLCFTEWSSSGMHISLPKHFFSVCNRVLHIIFLSFDWYEVNVRGFSYVILNIINREFRMGVMIKPEFSAGLFCYALWHQM